MRSILILLLAAAWAVTAPGQRLYAQEGPFGSVAGFNGLSWGVSQAEIEVSYGPPAQTDTLPNGVTVLAYNDTLLDSSAVTLYAVLKGHGLVKGQHMVPLDLEAGDCERQYRRFRDHVTLRFPLITPVENSDYPYDADFCTAVSNQRGLWATQWTDQSTGSVVTLIVERGSDLIKLIYESSTFIEWLASTETEDS